MEPAGGAQAPQVSQFRIADLHMPDILPILGMPTLQPPPRRSYEPDADAGLTEQPSAATLDAVIKMLGEADVSHLRPLETPKIQPGEPTPLVAAVQAKNRSILHVKNAGAQRRLSGAKRAAVAPPPRSPAPSVPAPPPGTGATPGTVSVERPKRARTSLKLMISSTEKPTLAATKAEETAATAAALVAALDTFCKRHRDLLADNVGDEDVEMKEGGSGGEEETEQEEGGDGKKGGADANGSGAGASSAHTLLADVRRLGDVVVRACGDAAAVGQVPREALAAALRTLRAAIERGRHSLLEEGDDEGDAHVAGVLASLEAAVVALRLCVAAAATDAHAVSEEVIDAAVDAARFQMQHNVLPFHDARLRAATRPTLGASAADDGAADAADEAGPSKSPTKAKGKAKGRGKAAASAKKAGSTGPQPPAALDSVMDRVQSVLSLLCSLLPQVKVPTSMLVPLLRSSVASLTVPALPALQVRAASFMAAAFRSHADLRRTLLDDLFAHAAPYLGTSARSLRRDFSMGDAPSGGASDKAAAAAGSIQVFTAAVLQMVQGCVELPAADATPGGAAAGIGPALKSSDYFWALFLDRLPLARTHKAETDHDYAALLQGVVADLLAAAAMPEWPAAATLLLRLAFAINSQRGLQHTDPVVRQACVDLLGKLLTAVHGWEAAVRADAEWLEGLAADNSYPDATTAAQELLLKRLADGQHGASAGAAAARRFWLVRSLAETAAAAAAGGDEPDGEAGAAEVATALLDTRKKAEELDAMVFDTGVGAADAGRLMRQCLHAAFSRAAPAMLSWLLEMLDPRAQAPTTRAKAVKALADLAAADPAVLSSAGVQAAVERSLTDDSISVREAALGLLGRHMAGDPELTLSLLGTVIKAVEDPGPSVRKCAIKILKESAICVPGFPRATDACCALLPRASDPEESVQNAVAKVFHALWFSSRPEDTDGAAGAPSLEARAARLADVAAAAYDAGGAAIHLPMDSQTPLVGVLRAALGWEARGDLRVEWKAGREVAAALLESVLAAQQRRVEGGGEAEGDEDEDAARPALLALHALAVTDPDFVVPESDPQRFLRALAPHLKASPDSSYTTEVDRRCAAERLLCVLNIVETALSQIDRLADSLGALADVPADLVALINHHRYTQVVAAACKCLAALATRSAAAAARLLQVAQVYFSWLQNPEQHVPSNLPRFLFILGQLCRHGADVMERAAAAAAATGASPSRVTLSGCMATFGKYWKYAGPPAQREQIQRCALEATGQLAIARPLTMVTAKSDARSMLDAALKRNSPSGFKLAALGTLTELLEADAESLERRQKQQLAGAGGGAAAGSARKRGATAGSTAKKKKARGKKGALAGDSDEDGGGDGTTPRATVVATENGEGDSLSQSSAVLQQHWESVLALATEGAGGGPRTAADAAGIRRRVVALMDVVLRDGLVGPWTAVPALVALCSDAAAPDVAARALRLLCDLAEKHPQYVDAGRLTAGLEQAYRLHCRGDAAPPPAALGALGAMYLRLVWPSRPRRNEFLRALLRQFRSSLSAGAAAAKRNGGAASAAAGPPLRLLGFVAAVAAALPLKRAEEACILIQEAAGACASHADAVLVELNTLLGVDADEDDGAAAAGVDPAALAAPCRAAATLLMLHRLRARLERAYGISAERAAAFAAAGKRKTAEEGNAVSADPLVAALDVQDLGSVDLKAVDPEVARKLYAELEGVHGGGGAAGEDDD